MLQQDLCSFVIPDAAQLQFYGLQCRLYLSSHRLIATIQEAAHTHIHLSEIFHLCHKPRVLTINVRKN